MTQLLIDNNWTLFLDRDGVINHEQHMGYINTWEEFKFYDGALEAFQIFAKRFKHIVIVTNQRGIGRGITKVKNLDLIHKNMTEAIVNNAGKIDGIYYCGDLDINSGHRKPNTGMAFDAQKDLPAIDFSKSVMVGNNISDMEFGHSIGASTILLLTTMDEIPAPLTYLTASYKTLLDFAKSL